MPKPTVRKVAVIGTEPVTGKIGGLGLRQLNIARQLAKKFSVTLYTPFNPGDHSEPFPIKTITHADRENVFNVVRKADALVAAHPFGHLNDAVAELGRPMAVDLCPITYFEDLERLRQEDKQPFNTAYHFSIQAAGLAETMTAGDFFFCPGEKERDFYLGVLSQTGKLSPAAYKEDPHFRNIIDVVPFGLPTKKPKTGRNILRGQVKGIGEKDFIILWGGSLWNWYDCATPVEAMAKLRKSCPRVKLVFMPSVHPANTEPPEEYHRTKELARKKGLLNKNVFFYDGWVPYDQRDYYLSESDVGITTFKDHIENAFSFRVRLMDYLWAGLPIVTNPGNSLSDVIEEKGLGAVVPFEDAAALADALERLAKNPAKVRKIRERMQEERKRFYWSRTVKPLVRFLQDPVKRPSAFANPGRPLSLRDLGDLKANRVLYLRSSPIDHSREAVKAIKKLFPQAAVDVIVQNDLPAGALGDGLNEIRMPGSMFIPGQAAALVNNDKPYDAVVCGMFYRDISFYKNVLLFASSIQAGIYLAFNPDYQFNTITEFCRKEL